MRKAALLVAVTLAAAISATPSNAASKADPAIAAQQNSANLFRDALNPYVATAQPAATTAKKSTRHHRAVRHVKKAKKK